jgi:dihydroorotase
MSKTTAFLNARLIDPATGLDQLGGLLVKNGKIEAVGPEVSTASLPDGTVTHDCGGQVLCPGLVDMRVHISEPGNEHKETIAETSAVAAEGGVTSLVGLPDTAPVTDTVPGLQYIARKGRQAKSSKVYAFGSITVGTEGKELTEMGLLTEAGAVGFSDANRTLTDAVVMSRALSYAKTFDKVIINFPLDPSLSTGVMNKGELSTRLGLGGICTTPEVMQIERDIRLAEMTGGKLHVGPITCHVAIEAIRVAKDRGVNITASTAPHYFSLNETTIGDYRTFGKFLPPLRDEFNRREVAKAVADGTIDVVVSDHHPHDPDSKRVPFAQASFGAVGLETLLPMCLRLFHEGLIKLPELLKRVTSAPAEILGIAAGNLSVGAPADLVLFNPNKPYSFDPASLVSKCKNTPYENFPLQGKVLMTVVDGRIIKS